mgnify:FL=1
MLKDEFSQDGEFKDPQYDVRFLFPSGKNEIMGYLYFKGGNWNFAGQGEYGLPAHLMIEIGEKMKELDESVKKQLFLWRF